jgi:tetratricopeptide (TPR) repeat protein
MSNNRRYTVIVILVGVVSGLGSIAANVAANTLPDSLKPYLGLAFPVFVVCVIVVIFLTVYQSRSDRKSLEPVKAVSPQPETTPESSTTINQSGGVEINGNVVNVYGDIVGRNKEVNQAATSDRPADAPPRSIWYYAHPYPMPANFTGRAAERAMLTDWLNNDHDHPLLVIRALGGFGKSALAWQWLTHDVDNKQWPHVVWWSFYEGDASFENFLRDTLISLQIDPPPGPRQQVDALLRALQQSEILLILDGFERELRAFSGMNAAYQGDDAPAPENRGRAGEGVSDRDTDCISLFVEQFIRGVASMPRMSGKVLMTTRLLPRALHIHGDRLQGCREEELKGLQPIDAIAYFHSKNIRGTHTEIETACVPYGYHPLSLSLLAGLIVNDLQQPGDIAVAKRLDVSGDLVQRQHHVLEQSYNSLTPTRQKLLSRIACFRGAISYDALHTLADKDDAKNFDNDLRDLLARGLLHRDEKTNRYDLHPIVRRYAYDQLTTNDRTTAHSQLRDYFSAVPKAEKIQTLDDLIPVIELYHHTVCAEQYNEAAVLYYDRLNEPLYYQFGAYQLKIELLRALFPDGEDKLPPLDNDRSTAWALATLANSYSLSGQPRRAVLLFEQQNTLQKKLTDKKNLAIGFENVATQQMAIGTFKAAEANLRRSIELCREIEDEFWEAAGHLELGRLVAYRGVWQESEDEFTASLLLAEKLEAAQGQGLIWAYRALHALLMTCQPLSPEVGRRVRGESLNAARRALELADEWARTQYPMERDYVRAHWLLGAAHRLNGNLIEAERHLSEALTRCRNINMVDTEADILLDLARLRVDQNEREEALRLAQEALLITERSEYVLQGADVHLLMAQLALDAVDKAEALQHVREARRLATCDGEPYVYRVAYDEAGELLKKLGEVK